MSIAWKRFKLVPCESTKNKRKTNQTQSITDNNTLSIYNNL